MQSDLLERHVITLMIVDLVRIVHELLRQVIISSPVSVFLQVNSICVQCQPQKSVMMAIYCMVMAVMTCVN